MQSNTAPKVESTDVITMEQERLAKVYDAITRITVSRARTIADHDSHTIDLEKERLESVSWREKNDLTLKLVEHGHFDPRRYLPEYKQLDSPYFGLIGIDDQDPRIGRKEYLIGRQMLMNGNRVLIVDWRKAEISRLYYDYEPGEEYEETIQKHDRYGVITHKHKVGIEAKRLHRIEASEDVYELLDGEWQKNGAAVQTTSDTKSQQKDHRMVDIVSLISAEQFRMITKETQGCVLIHGSAGSGKSTVALHRLSYLQFDDPGQFRQERCLVLMFNRTLRDYIQKTSKELLGKTKVDTFSAWVLTALSAFSVSVKVSNDDPYFAQKKMSIVSDLLTRYTANTRAVDPVMDLWRFFQQDFVAAALFPGKKGLGETFVSEMERRATSRENAISFADASILLRLCQLRRRDAVVTGALNWYDHITVDEGQDLSCVDLETVLAATTNRRSLTVCADEKQQILSFVDGTGFGNFKTRLHACGLDKQTLSVSYRSAKEIMDLASWVSGRQVDTSRAHSGVMEFHKTLDFKEAAGRLRTLVDKLSSEDPNSLTAVICKKKTDVKLVSGTLAGVQNLHIGGEISFDPGVLVVNAHQVKGVEFTNVIIWDPSDQDYRQSATDRNLLYVAITRACKRLYIIHWKPLAKALKTYSNRP